MASKNTLAKDHMLSKLKFLTFFCFQTLEPCKCFFGGVCFFQTLLKILHCCHAKNVQIIRRRHDDEQHIGLCNRCDTRSRNSYQKLVQGIYTE